MTEDSKASRHVAIDLSPMLTAAGVAAWQALDELANRVDIRQWMVAGGMMVMLHGQRYGVDLQRTTKDADVVVDVRVFGRDSMRRVAAQLEEFGFGVEASPDGVTRYVRVNAKVDLLAPDGLGDKPIETSPPGRAVMAPGATQALERTETVDVAWQQGRTTTVRVPPPRCDHRQVRRCDRDRPARSACTREASRRFRLPRERCCRLRLSLLQERLPEFADGQLSDVWIDELDRRLADVESGNVPTVKWDSVKERLLAKYAAQ